MENFVPSYQNEEERMQILKEKNRKDRIRATIITVAVIAVIALVSFLSYTIANANYNKYKPYEQKMNIYGFSKLYDNQEPNTKEKVTKSEAIKMLLGCVYNVSSIDGIALQTDETYKDAIWVEYAKKQGIIGIDEITSKNADDKVKYEDVLVWIYNIQTKLLNKDIDTSANVDVKDIDAYNTDIRLAIYDLINAKIITVNTKNIDGNRNLYKGKLNELIVNMAEQYNLITVGNARININEEKIPSNASEYPYTLASVQKDVYELPFIITDDTNKILPVDYYRDNKEYYSQIKKYVESYYNYLLNVNYEDITIEQIKRNLKKYARTEFNDDTLNAYVEYVKNNHIKLSGTATAMLPCIYFDGKDYRVRMKLEFKVESSDSDTNLLLWDENTKYNSKEYTLYADVIMNKNEGSQTLFVEERALSSMLSKENRDIVSNGE